MKSAFELAMERLEKESPTRELTEEQKAKLSELSKVYEAKIADKELFLNGEIAKAEAAGEFDQIEQLTKQLASERKVLEEERSRRKTPRCAAVGARGVPKLKPVQGGDHQRVADRAVGDQAGDVRQQGESGGDVLAVIEVGVMFQLGVPYHDGMHLVVHDRRVGVDEADRLGRIAGVAGFLPQFAGGSFRRGFSGVDHASRQFKLDQVGSLPVLLDHHQFIGCGQGDYVAPVHGLDDEKAVIIAGTW